MTLDVYTRDDSVSRKVGEYHEVVCVGTTELKKPFVCSKYDVIGVNAISGTLEPYIVERIIHTAQGDHVVLASAVQSTHQNYEYYKQLIAL